MGRKYDTLRARLAHRLGKGEAATLRARAMRRLDGMLALGAPIRKQAPEGLREIGSRGFERRRSRQNAPVEQFERERRAPARGLEQDLNLRPPGYECITTTRQCMTRTDKSTFY